MAIGDANFESRNYEHAKAALSDAMHCPGAIGDPFIHLRLGQCQFELGNLPRANDELARAYMGGGKEIFDAEDPKYFSHLKTVATTRERRVVAAGTDGRPRGDWQPC